MRKARSSRSRSFVCLYLPLPLFEGEVFGVLENEPAGAFEHLLAEGSFGLALEFAAEVGEAVVEEFHEVKVIEDVNRIRLVVADGEGVRGGHIRGDGFDLRMGLIEPFPEGNQGVGALAFAEEDDAPTDEIEHDGEVVVAVTDRDFVDGEAFEVLEFGRTEAGTQIGL